MNWKEILNIVWVTLACIAFIFMIIQFILDIKASNKYWESMYAHLELMKTSLKKEHDLLKKVQEYGEWLDIYHALMRTNVKLEDTEFNNGVLSGARDIEESFLKYLGEYVDGKESSD